MRQYRNRAEKSDRFVDAFASYVKTEWGADPEREGNSLYVNDDGTPTRLDIKEDGNIDVTIAPFGGGGKPRTLRNAYSKQKLMGQKEFGEHYDDPSPYGGDRKLLKTLKKAFGGK